MTGFIDGVKEAVGRWWRAAAVVPLVLCGLYGVADALNVWVALAVGAVVLLALWRPSWREATVVLLRVLGAVLVAFLAMVGVAALLSLLLDRADVELPIAVGLLIAMQAFGLVAYWYLRQAGWATDRAALVAVELAALVVLAAPYVVGRLNADTTSVAGERAVPAQLDVLIVTDGVPHLGEAKPPPTPVLGEFDVTYSVGYAAGDGVRWTLLGGADQAAALDALAEGRQRPRQAGRPRLRPEADRVLLLYVDGTPPVVAGDPAELPDVPGEEGEVASWEAVARRVSSQIKGPLPTFALLQTTATARLHRWQDFGRPNGPISVQVLGSQTATDAAVRLAVAAPTAQQDLALAMQFRPILLFDKYHETAPRPLSVAALFNEGRVRLCHDQGLRTTCDEPITDPRLLRSGGTHLRLKLPKAKELKQLALREDEESRRAADAAAEPAAAAPPPPEGVPPAGTVAAAAEERVAAKSAIYVHPVSVSREGKELLYLDYWWYLPYNPVALGGGALCGAGMVIAGVTCQDHESDWEGVTVVVDRTGKAAQPVAVQYAQHSNVVRYSWTLLREKWDGNTRLENRIPSLTDAPSRPLVFVAAGTHASYPLPCKSRCHQFPDAGIGERPYFGDLPWSGNDTGACGKSSCLQTLPTQGEGSRPALWNGYEGSWGELHCFLTYYCDSGPPPKAPGEQGRYQHPTWFDGYAGTDWRFHPAASAE